MITIKEIRKKALDTGLSVNYIIKDMELTKIFKKLEGKIENIILKGGTALNRVYFTENNRVSFSKWIFNWHLFSQLL